MKHGGESQTCEQGAPRLDQWLATWPSVGSRRRAREAIDSGKVVIDGAPVPSNGHGQSLAQGAVVTVVWNQPGSSARATRAEQRLNELGLVVRYEDGDVVVIDKPPGMLTDTAPGQEELDSVKKRLDERLRVRNETAFVCHRIDRDTSGLVVFARNPTAHAHLREQFATHTPERVYLAIIQGRLLPPEGTFSDWMRWDRDRMRQVASQPGGAAVLASSTYRTVASFVDTSLLAVHLNTGRRNQIRVHLQLRGVPLVGERIYLSPALSKLPAGFARQALHAWKVSFTQPTSGARISVESPLPPDLVNLRKRLERSAFRPPPAVP